MAILTTHEKFRACPGEKVTQFRHARNWTRAIFPWLILLAVLTGGFRIETAPAQTTSHEYQIKAVFLFNFAQFTEWPTNAFDQPDSPLVIGILGSDPFGGLLEDAVRNEQVKGRKFEVQHFSRVEEIKTCHILFISQSEAPRLDKIVAAVKEKPFLTVSDIENSAYRGVCVRFFTENNKIRLRINTNALKAANLVMSSKLLRVAELVPAKSP